MGALRAAQEAILRCLYSIADNNSYLLFNRDPVDRMVAYLRAFFRAEGAEPGCSLAIHGGMQGARLTHSHERQFHYVLQSLTLWREISHEVRRPPFAGTVRPADPGRAAALLHRRVALRCSFGAPLVQAWHPSSLIIATCCADVQAVEPGGGRPAGGGQCVPADQHGAGAEPRAAGAERVARHARHPRALPAGARTLRPHAALPAWQGRNVARP